jgi:hypothetical protein
MKGNEHNYYATSILVSRKVSGSGETFGEDQPGKVTVTMSFQLQADVNTRAK